MANPLSAIAGYVKANRPFFVILLLIIVAAAGYRWYQLGFSLDFSRFFAAEPPALVINGGSGPYDHGDRLSISWSATNSDRCESANGWFDTGGAVEGTADSPPIDACAASQGSVGVRCFYGSDSGYAQRNFSINSASCPSAEHLACRNNSCTKVPGGGGAEDGCTFSGQSCGAPPPPPPSYTCTNTAGQFCYTGPGACPSGSTGGSGTCQSGQCCRPQAPSGSAPTNVNLTVSPGTVAPGGSVTLTWSSSGATSCEVTAGNFGAPGTRAIPTSGSATEAISPSTPAGTQAQFRIKCSNAYGSTESPIRSVTVQGAPVYEHLECRNNACTVIEGAAANDPGCTAAGQSCTPPGHMACVNRACVRIPGQGANTCSSDAQCATQAPSCPCGGSSSWGDANIRICKISGNIDTSQRCTILGPNQQASVTVAICNNSSGEIYSKEALFYTNQQTCGAHADNPGHSSISGDTRVGAGQVGYTTYSFNTGDCGSWQLDDTWRGSTTIFVIGQVINTGRNCPTTTTVTPPPQTSTPPATHLECRNNACTRVSGGGANQCSPEGSSCAVVTTVTPPPTTTAQPRALQCVGMVTQASVGQSVEFGASGGTGVYAWYAPGGAPASGGGTPFSVAYAVPGFKTVTVVSGGDQATCTVTILAPQTSTPPSALVCRPESQSATSGQAVTVQASGGSPNYTWSAPDGNPSSQRDGTSFTTRFSHGDLSPKTYPVTVTDAAGRTATCNVTVSCAPPPCPAPPDGCRYEGGNACACGQLVCPSEQPLVCAPANQTVQVGQSANFIAAGGTSRTFSWSAPGGNPPSGAGPNQSFSTIYTSTGSYRVTVSAGEQSATCDVLVQRTPPPTTVTPPPTRPRLNLEKEVRNVTEGGSEDESTNAQPGQTVEFRIRVSSTGSGPVLQANVRDTLPAGLTYQSGTTTVDGTPAADGIIGSGLNLGDLAPGRTVTVRFRATVASEAFFSMGSTTLVNTVWARASNAPEEVDFAFVNVMRGQGLDMTLVKLGRNLTRGDTTQTNPVYAAPGQTVEFVLRVRNNAASPLADVLVRDIVPQGITFVPGTVRLNGQPASDALVSSGLAVGTLAPGAEAVITFSGRVAASAQLPAGTTTFVNTVQASATGVPLLQAQALVIVAREAAPPVTQVPTGPGESALLALIVSAVITLLYVGYTSTDTFRRREAEHIARGGSGPFDFNA